MFTTPLISHGEVYAERLFDRNKLAELNEIFEKLKVLVPSDDEIVGKLGNLKTDVDNLLARTEEFLENIEKYRSDDGEGTKSVYEETFDEYFANRLTAMDDIIASGDIGEAKEIDDVYTELINSAHEFITNTKANIGLAELREFFDDEFDDSLEKGIEIIYELQSSVISEPGMTSDAAIRWQGGTFINLGYDTMTVASFEKDSLRKNKEDFIGSDSSKIFGIESERYDIVLYAENMGMVYLTTDGVCRSNGKVDPNNNHPTYDYHIRHNDDYRGSISEVKSFHPEPLQLSDDLEKSKYAKSRSAVLNSDGEVISETSYDEYYSTTKPSLLLSIWNRNSGNGYYETFIALREHGSHGPLGSTESVIFNTSHSQTSGSVGDGDGEYHQYKENRNLYDETIHAASLTISPLYFSNLHNYKFNKPSDIRERFYNNGGGGSRYPYIFDYRANIDNPILRKKSSNKLDLINKGNLSHNSVKERSFDRSDSINIAKSVNASNYSIKDSVHIMFKETGSDHRDLSMIITKKLVYSSDNMLSNKYENTIFDRKFLVESDILELDDNATKLSSPKLSSKGFDLFENMMIRVYPSNLKLNSSVSSSLKSGQTKNKRVLNFFSGLLLKEGVLDNSIDLSLIQVSTFPGIVNGDVTEKDFRNSLIGAGNHRKFFNINETFKRHNDTGVKFSDNVDLYKHLVDLGELNRNYDLDFSYDIKTTFHLDGVTNERDVSYFSNIPFATQYYTMFLKYFKTNKFDGEFSYFVINTTSLINHDVMNYYSHFMNPIFIPHKTPNEILTAKSILTSSGIKNRIPFETNVNLDKYILANIEAT